MSYKEKHVHLVPGARLFQPFVSLTLIVDAICTALDVIRGDRGHSERGDMTTVHCAMYPFTIKFPLHDPTYAMANNLAVGGCDFRIERFGGPPPSQEGAITGYAKTSIEIIVPIFVTFFERHQPWLKKKFGTNPYGWPMIFNFARFIRNILVHNEGVVYFKNMNALPVSWHSVSYSPANTGHQAVGPGADIALGDLLVLLSEMTDELDRLGCPQNP